MSKNNFKKRLKGLKEEFWRFTKKVHLESITFASKIMFFRPKMLKNGVKISFFGDFICLFDKIALYLQNQNLIITKKRKNPPLRQRCDLKRMELTHYLFYCLT